MNRFSHYSSILFAPIHTSPTASTPSLPARFATGVASITCLYHLHTCFSLQRAVVAALSSAGTSDKEIDFASREWWLGRTILLTLSMGLQKVRRETPCVCCAVWCCVVLCDAV